VDFPDPETPEMAIIGVLFADRSPPLHRLPAFSEAGFTGVMLDTANKNGSGLTHICSHPQLHYFIQECSRLDLLCGLAGSLTLEDVPNLLSLVPDYLGFRGALCTKSRRTQKLDPHRVLEIRAAIPRTGIRQWPLARGRGRLSGSVGIVK